ncbi:MAG: endopeptidase La [Capsulimonadaceae bacterium]|nr:endopeptidase La [Capsulimonadaceae bacterium]
MSDDIELITPRPRRARRSTAGKPRAAKLPFPRELPLLPIRDNVYFPSLIFPLFVGREKSVKALEETLETHRHVLLVTQRQIDLEDPEPSDLYEMGTVSEVLQILKVPDGTMRVMLEGISRFRVTKYLQTEPCFKVRGVPVTEDLDKDLEREALMRSCLSQFENIVNNGRNIPPEAILNVMNIEEPGRLADHIAWHLSGLRVETKQELLETLNAKERLDRLGVLLNKEVEIIEVQKNIRSRVEKEMGDNQREFILREQMKAIQQELGERDDRLSEIDEYRQKIEECAMPELVAERATKELGRLEKMPYAAPDGVIVRTYLDWLTTLPWSKASKDKIDIEEAAKTLDADHYGLPKVKERILEFLAIRKLTGTLKGPILCFVGPPGVGKTSIGRSIARAVGRKFVRISLGGVRDEAEIRGHRRTYVGALPGRIIQGLKTAGTRNPVFMLDEIDKLASDFRGDPSSALLEALDPEQNFEFSDHYLEVPFDLSDVMFITTANLLDPIPPALRDRMEVISFSGYIEDEKAAIARQFLIPKQLKDHGLTAENLDIQESAIHRVIREHTREAGVRNLERELASVCRKVARKVAEGNVARLTVTEDDVQEYLGRKRFHYGIMEEQDQIGAATGLAYTEFGGDVISIEVSLLRGKDGRLTLTGQLGDVMKESAQAALSYVRSKARYLDLPDDFYERTEIHLHVPAGGVPKDGPSAGITIATALASALTGRAVHKDLAMTGEITLRGRVLPIGGLKEKVLAAHRAGIRTVLFPADNLKDVDEIPQNVRDDMELIQVAHMDDVLPLALLERTDGRGERDILVG